MTKNISDVFIIGAGPAGCFAALRFAQKHKGMKVVLNDLGAYFLKRRRFLEGALGSMPQSDGKFYPNDINKIEELCDGRQIRFSKNYVYDILEEIGPWTLTKDVHPNNSALKRIKEQEYDIELNDYYQWKPASVHLLSRYIVDQLESNPDISFSFNNEVFDILKKKNYFQINTEQGEFHTKKVILCAGRSGWRWANNIYKKLGLIVNDNYAKIGARVELSASYLKDFNKSHCSLSKKDLTIGPFSYNGSVLPEDHNDFTTSAFRSNEDRWKSDKVSFSIIKNIYCKNEGVDQTNRLGSLAHVLSDERVSKEKIKDFIKNEEHQLKLVPEYSFLKDIFVEVEKIVPNLLLKGSFYVPNITAMASEIRLTSGMETELEGFMVVGESANIKGLLGSAISGVMAANNCV